MNEQTENLVRDIENTKKWQVIFWKSILGIVILYILAAISSAFMRPEITYSYVNDLTIIEEIAKLFYTIFTIFFVLTLFFMFYALGRSHNDNQ